jgi:hypothetical protein
MKIHLAFSKFTSRPNILLATNVCLTIRTGYVALYGITEKHTELWRGNLK